ncbi:MAG: precorrin-6A reductase [Lachnospiraceae bacterium]|nr:precorrin-6A reductase [Lachnospiraceae bacterium]
MADTILIFGGTSEGRELAEAYQNGWDCHVYVATKTGAEYLDETAVSVHVGRLTEADMETEFWRLTPRFVLDATHPYATEVSANIKEACGICGVSYVRVLRDALEEAGDLEVENATEAAAVLCERFLDVPVLLTTGSKELTFFSRLIRENPEVYARILPGEENEAVALNAGLTKERIVTGIGPFSEEENRALLRTYGIKVLVTKESGARGGYAQKLTAAKKEGALSLVIRRPKEDKGIPMEEAKRLAKENKKSVSIVGCGTGSAEQLTKEGLWAMEHATLVIGAKRLLDALRGSVKEDARFVAEYHAQNIAQVVSEAEEENIALLVSGDSGFYSGAASYAKELAALATVRILPGISSVSALCAKTGVSWEDAAIFSLHGRKQNYYKALAGGRKIILLGGEGFCDVLGQLCELGYGDLRVCIGENLGCEGERLIRGSARELKDSASEPLSVLLIDRNAQRRRTVGLRDEDFIRNVRTDGGEKKETDKKDKADVKTVPMTKSEVRAVCMSRLAIGEYDTVYDVGAGTGSISVEASIAACYGSVYAVERKEAAVELIKENAKKFLCKNLEVVLGKAPEALKDLPKPDAVMIGGSGGALIEIMRTVYAKNPLARIVVTAVSTETLQAAQEAEEIFGCKAEYTQISVTRTGQVGAYHMMQAQNPVWVITFEKEG